MDSKDNLDSKIDVSINSFLPAYPTIGSRDDNLFDLFPSSFEQSIYNKREFNSLISLPNAERIKDEKFHPQPHQLFVSRYANSQTLYDRQLVIHTMGTGKTALAMMTAENLIGNGFVGGVIAVPGKKFFRNFMAEIVKITDKKYFPEKYQDMERPVLDRAIKKNIRKNYKFITFEAFANSLNKMKMQEDQLKEQLRNEYSNRIIIVDEAHNLRIKPDKKETSEVYKAFHLFLHSLVNCRILLMTATPQKDRWNELADLVNLILPESSQLPTSGKFDTEYANDGETIRNVDQLKKVLKGTVTTLRAVPSTVPRVYVGKKIGTLTVFDVDVSVMSAHQSEGYMEAYRKDTNGNKTEGIYLKSRQAVNFVFPDGSYGKDGFKKYMTKPHKEIKRAKKGTRSFQVENISGEFLSELRGNTHEETLAKISKFSVKYAETIRGILNQFENKAGNTYVYNSFVDGGGCILFSRLLELFGYTRSINGLEDTDGKRYVILTNRTIDDEGKIVSNVQTTFNHPDNAQGQKIQVIIGSKTSGEGFSFYNVENIVIHTPFFNYSPIDQAIARGIRYGSHDEIMKIYREEKKEFSVKIHHCVSIPDSEHGHESDSIDLVMYQMSQEKDKRIKLGERMLKEVSYDCGTNRLVNMQGADGSRECEYLNCVYKCDGLNEDFSIDQDFSTSNYYYSLDEEKEITTIVKRSFRKHTSITLNELKKELINFHPFVIIKTLKNLIERSEIIYNQYGFKTYLRESNDIYFLVDTMDKNSRPFAAYYTAEPAIKSQITLDSYIETLQSDSADFILDQVLAYIEAKDFESIPRLLNNLPISMVQSLLEMIVEAELRGIEHHQDFRTWFLDLYKSYIFTLEDGRIASTLEEDTIICRYETGEWKDCSHDTSITKEIKKNDDNKARELEDNDYGYYAIVNKALIQKDIKSGFWILDVNKAKIAASKPNKDQRKKIRGEKCGTGVWKVGRMASVAYELGLDIPDGKIESREKMIEKIDKEAKFITIDYSNFSDTELKRFFRLIKGGTKGLCQILYEFFLEHNLIRYTTENSMK